MWKPTIILYYFLDFCLYLGNETSRRTELNLKPWYRPSKVPTIVDCLCEFDILSPNVIVHEKSFRTYANLINCLNKSSYDCILESAIYINLFINRSIYPWILPYTVEEGAYLSQIVHT